MSHRLRGYTWNLVSENPGSVEIRELHQGTLNRTVLDTKRQFEEASLNATSPSDGTVFTSANVSVKMIELDHGCVSAGYLVREPDRMNIDTLRMQNMGLQPGPWLKDLKSPDVNLDEAILIGDQNYTLGQLRESLVAHTKGESLAYLTDFRPTGTEMERLVDFIRDVDIVICENNYRDEDIELAIKNYHLTSTEVGKIAAAANVGKLILFHLSDRYQRDDWAAQLMEVKEIFPETYWPEHWTDLLNGNSKT